MDWFKKHTDTAAILSVVVGCALWMNGSLHTLRYDLKEDITALDKEVSIVKTVLLMKNILPGELAHKEGVKDER